MCFSILGTAQEVSFHYVKYATKNGLPSSEVYEILQDREGLIWVCSDAGVARFNGYEFESFTTNDGLADNTVFHFYEDFKGRVWFLSYSSKLCYYEKGIIHSYKYNDKLIKHLPNERIRAISIDENETITFVGRRTGIGTITKDGVIDVKTSVDTPYGQVGFHTHKEDLMIYGLLAKDKFTNLDVLKVDSNKKIQFASISHAWSSICEHRLSENQFLFGIGNNICYYTLGDFHCLKMGNKTLQSIYLTEHGEVWLAYNGDGIRIYDKIEDVFNGSEPSNHVFIGKNISDIKKDTENGIWLAIQNDGLYYLPNPAIQVYQLSNDEITNRVSALTSHKGNIYAGTSNGMIFKIANNAISSLLYENNYDYSNNTILSLTNGQDNGGAFIPKFSNSVRANGRTYSIREVGLRVVAGGDTTKFLNNVRCNAIHLDQNNQVWIGTNNGLYRMKGNYLFEMSAEHNLFQFRINDIGQLADGTLLFATNGVGLLSWKDGKLTIVDKGLTSTIVKNIHIDEEQTIWLGTPSGLNRLTKNKRTGYSILCLKDIHGLPSTEINEVTSVGSVMWLATNSGLARFDKGKINLNRSPPRTTIDGISINEKEQELQIKYDLKYNQNHIEIEFTGLCYRNAGNLDYRYKLVGVDENWIEEKSRTVRYPSLRQGAYAFHLQAANENGIWSDSRELLFNISPPFWNTWWFVISCITFGVLVLFLIVRYRELKERKRADYEKVMEQQKLVAIKAELKALRAQMNPHFTFNTLSAIQAAINTKNPTIASNYLVDFATLIRKVLENSKYSSIKLEEEIEMIKLYVALEQFRFAHKFTFDLIIDENVDLGFVEIPSMVVQPFIENAIIHGLNSKLNNGHLLVAFQQNTDDILCVIEDNGIGREASVKIKNRKGLKHNSMAMEITDDRIKLWKELGKEFSVEIIDLKDQTGQPKGTKVNLVFPI